MTVINTQNFASSLVFRANRWYMIGILSATLLALGLPHVLGTFVPCAQFMEVEWAMVAFLCLAGIGIVNIFFSLTPIIEAVLPRWGISSVRVFLLVIIPLLVLMSSLFMAFSPFWYALLNDPELLCD